jgi:hypothetical protein
LVVFTTGASSTALNGTDPAHIPSW